MTAIDGNTPPFRSTHPEGAVIESYASVDMTQYSATEETDEVDLTDAMIGLAQNGALDGADASQIAVGDMLLLSHDKDTGELLQAVIYPPGQRRDGRRLMHPSALFFRIPGGAADGPPSRLFVLNGSPRPARPSIPSDFTDCSLHFREKNGVNYLVLMKIFPGGLMMDYTLSSIRPARIPSVPSGRFRPRGSPGAGFRPGVSGRRGGKRHRCALR